MSEKEDEDKEGGKGRGGEDNFLDKNPFEIFNSVSIDEIDEKLNANCAEYALHENRIALKSKGHKVEALDRIQENRMKRQQNIENRARQTQSGGGKQHPALPPQSGMIDKIVEPAQDAPNEPGMENKNKNKLKSMPKFKQSQGEHKITYKHTNKIDTPRPSRPPPTFKPPGQ